MLDEHDDAQIRLVAQGLCTLVGPRDAGRELVRLYGTARVMQAIQDARNAGGRGHRSGARGIVIDLAETRPSTIDLCDPAAPAAAPPALARRAASAYAQRPAAATPPLQPARRTFWL